MSNYAWPTGKIILLISNDDNNEYVDWIKSNLHHRNNFIYEYNVKTTEDIKCFPYVSDDSVVTVDNVIKEYDIVIVIQPLITNFSSLLYNKLFCLERDCKQMIIMDVPSIVKYKGQYENVSKLYKKVIDLDYDRLSTINNEVEEVLLEGEQFLLRDNLGTCLYFRKKGNTIYSEKCSLEEERIFQLPGGEVFFAVDTARCFGTVFINNTLCEVRDGKVKFSTSNDSSDCKEYTICEFGIGTNYKLPYIKSLEISEKSKESCHLGFGNNLLFGGDVDCDYHFDVVFSDFELFIDGKLLDISDFFNKNKRD